VNKLRLLAIRTSFHFFSPIFSNYFGRKAAKLFCTPFRYARPAWEAAIVSGASQYVERDKYAYHLFGSEGPYVMFVHGWSGRGSQFGHYAKPLVERGYRVILFDGPAHFGEKQTDTDLREFMRAVVDCQNELGPLAAVVGHSFGGGAVALALANGLKSERAVLMATPANLQRVFDNFSRLIKLGRRARTVFYQVLVARVGMSEIEASIVSIAPKLRIPVLVVHDPKDNEVNFRSAGEIQAAWAGAQLYAPDRVGHYRILKDAAVIQKVVEFIVSK
jgi:pimeloyl-ACP methyl ester carboxylesterase